MALEPILRQAVNDETVLARLRASLRVWSVKGSHIIGSYARMANIEHPVELTVLGCAFGRLYDDLLDEPGRPGAADLATSLFRGQGFVPEDDYERLFQTLYLEIYRRLSRPPADPIHGALERLHQYQLRSRHQYGDELPTAELGELIREKGAHTLLVMFCLARAGMCGAEQELVTDLGATLQLLDDYQDCVSDRARGISTLSTRGTVTLLDIGHQILSMEPGFCRFYGPRRARRFLSELFVFLGIALAARYRRPVPSPVRAGRGQPPLRVLIARGPHVDRSRAADA
ncbi:MAG TPA: class 1 isoprenoid biosynthesis enzyme [Streptosporangiaceae bacterium]|nr:class 1 isoprenoid biosynthesis enzyme [Streptosporangiaceae bacterium]